MTIKYPRQIPVRLDADNYPAAAARQRGWG
jgi:hypothetical protein